jgi:hypothetical protein
VYCQVLLYCQFIGINDIDGNNIFESIWTQNEDIHIESVIKNSYHNLAVSILLEIYGSDGDLFSCQVEVAGSQTGQGDREESHSRGFSCKYSQFFGN